MSPRLRPGTFFVATAQGLRLLSNKHIFTYFISALFGVLEEVEGAQRHAAASLTVR
jgi:hypothetical protein